MSTSSPSLRFRFRPSPSVDPGACPGEGKDTCQGTRIGSDAKQTSPNPKSNSVLPLYAMSR